MRIPDETDFINDPLLDRCRDTLGPGPDPVRAFVPGRVELFGKHTDYAGGSSLLLATRQGLRMAARPAAEERIRIIPADRPGDVRLFRPGERPTLPPGDWLNYPATTARRLALNFGSQASLTGVDIAFAGDLPIAAGMSSSSALMVATFLVLAHLWHLDETPAWRAELSEVERLVEYLGCVENGENYGTLVGESGVGTFGGSEDHAAMLLCRPGRIASCSFAPTRLHEQIVWPRDWSCVIASSGVRAEKTGARLADYNRASRRARLAVELWNEARGTGLRHLGELAAGRDRSECDAIVDFLAARGRARENRNGPGEPQPEPEDLDPAGRFRQFVGEECVYTPAAREALRTADLEALGRAAERSHRAAREDLGTVIPETDRLQALAREAGAPAASYFGAGFGGSVWAVVPETGSGAEAFARTWLEAYTHEFPERSETALTLITRPGAPARVAAAGEQAC